VLPLLVLLMVGIMEVGVAFYDYLTIERATLEGARTAAFTGTAVDADCATVQSVVKALPAGFLDRIDRIEIYQADSNGDQLPGATNVWRYNGGTDPQDCDAGWTVAELWPATSRQTVVGTSAGAPPLDIIGIRIRMDRNWITSLPPFTGSYRIDEHSILRMEPEAYG
jgi:Flp pilus assembly protein TadG